MFYSVFMIECNSFVCACTSKTCLPYIRVTNSVGYRRLHAVYYRLFVYMFAGRVCDERPGRYVNCDPWFVNCHVALRNIPNTDRRTVERY